ncbi:MAG: NAD(P)/FAD-dependent oxidoreductase [Paracoccaceae bacterium]
MSQIVIIGGGVAGLSAGAALCTHAQVTVIEAETSIGYHASGRSAALFEPNYGNAPVRALSRASEAYHREANGGYLSPRGFLLLGAAGDTPQFETDLAGLGCDEIGPAEACNMVPILNTAHMNRAAYHAAAEDIDTDRLLQDFAKQIRHNGGKVQTGAPVSAITRDAQQWRIEAASVSYTADTLINAAGPWADDIAQMAGIAPLGLQPLRRSMARIAAPDAHDVSDWPMFFGAGETWYAKPDAGQLIVSPAEEHPCPPMDAWPDDMVLAEGFARYQEFVHPEITRPTATWAGLRTFAPDRALVLGAEPDMPDFIWSAGQGGYGFQTGPAAGQTVAALALGRTPDLPADVIAALSPARFR